MSVLLRVYIKSIRNLFVGYLILTQINIVLSLKSCTFKLAIRSLFKTIMRQSGCDMTTFSKIILPFQKRRNLVCTIETNLTGSINAEKDYFIVMDNYKRQGRGDVFILLKQTVN